MQKVKRSLVIGLLITGLAVMWCHVWLEGPLAGQTQMSMMSREEAAHIVRQFLSACGFSTNFHWQTTQDLPAGIEVPTWDWDLRRQLAPEDKDYTTVDEDYASRWIKDDTPYSLSYLFYKDDPPAEMVVNAWTGFLRFRQYALFDSNTEERGLANYPILTADQQRERALTVARNLFGVDVNLEVVGEDPDLTGENSGRFLIFEKDLKTGAYLLRIAFFYINSRSGEVDGAKISNRPVVISTVPNLTKEEAWQIAVQAMRDSLPIELRKIATFNIVGEEKVDPSVEGKTGLHVAEDSFLTQVLIWLFHFKSNLFWDEDAVGMVAVDAMTGEIWPGQTQSFGFVGYAPEEDARELIFREIKINDKDCILGVPLVLRDGRTYIWEGYGHKFGVERISHRLRNKQRKFEVTLSVKEIWQRKGRTYLPLHRICEVAGIRLWWDNERKVPILRVDWLDTKRLLVQRR
ncbi:MAG: hypothetical protein QW328_09765 [Nitrososphaerota archaeon]